MPRSRLTRSIRGRVTLAFSLATGLLLLLAIAALLTNARRAAEHEADELMREALVLLRADLRDPSARDRITRDRIATLATQGIVVSWVDPSGREQGTVLDPPGFWRTQRLTTAEGVLTAGVRRARIEEGLRRQATLLIALGTVALAGTSVGAWWLVGRTLLPIDRLARQARAAPPGRVRVHLDEPSHDSEIENLVGTLNGLLERIAAAANERGRFYAAASHELRTPLTALSGHLELALLRDRSADDYRRAITEAHTQARRLTELVQSLLTLNRLDTGTAGQATAPVALETLIEEALASLAGEIAARGLSVAWNPVPVPGWNASRAHAAMLVRNLIENAVRYADAGGTVSVELDSRRFAVANTAVALPPLDTEKLFEPFYRPDASRDTATGGNGLGLAICKAICESNGWAIRLEQPAGSVRVTVEQHEEE